MSDFTIQINIIAVSLVVIALILFIALLFIIIVFIVMYNGFSKNAQSIIDDLTSIMKDINNLSSIASEEIEKAREKTKIIYEAIETVGHKVSNVFNFVNNFRVPKIFKAVISLFSPESNNSNYENETTKKTKNFERYDDEFDF